MYVIFSDDITVTAGATHGLHLVGSVLLSPKATVFVEDPTYFIAINILKDDLGLNIVPGMLINSCFSFSLFRSKVMNQMN